MRYVFAWLSGIMIIVFILQTIFSTQYFVLINSLKFAEPWRLLTSIFAHGDIVHLINNLIAMVLFGLILEDRIGSKRVLWLFLFSGLLINVISPYERSLGASGAIYAIMGALVILRPGMAIYFSYVPMPLAVAGLFWLAQDVFGVFYPSNVANLAHIFGLIIGAVAGIYWRKLKLGDQLPKFSSKKDSALGKKLDRWEEIYMKRK